ncbi:S8 family serine peptidase [Gottfriedia acidiceleris]|uniref:S8 family serine peptidase n=1 Tax=Gottfriedia acidiceleris TaxID=371036 RepID=UPI003D1A060D
MKRGKLTAFRVMTTAAVTSLMFSSLTALADANDISLNTQSVEEIVEQVQTLFNRDKVENEVEGSPYKNVNYESSVTQHKPTDVVRLIVEIEEPTDTEITEKNKKELFKQKQDKVIYHINKSKNSNENADIKVKHRFFKGFNGFSVETEYQNLDEIKSIPGVTNVHVARTFQPTMGTSKELVQAQKVWNQYGYKGEGLLVAVVDTGLDYTHKDFNLPEYAKGKAKLTQFGIQTQLDGTEVNDIWYSDKVPSGYDWADNDNNPIPASTGSPHGTHVAGTVGANGDEANNGVQGIAPGVQLLAEKVFSDKGGGAQEDDIIAGIEHAISMGADVINLSLGTDAGYVGEADDPTQKVIREATEQGTLVVAAAGNAAYSTKNAVTFSSLLPYAENPDIGAVGEPGVSPYAISVASYENTNMHLNTLADATGFTLPFQDQTQVGANFKLSKALSPNTDYDLVYVNEGKYKTDFPVGKTNYIAVVKLLNTYSTHSSIQTEAARNGAKGIIFIPPTNTPDYAYIKLSATTLSATTSKAIGEELIQKLSSGQRVSMHLSNGAYVDNPAKNTMSYFSSVGSPTTLDFKPELSAPGGMIYSTVPGNDYQVLSGTSMATPHVAGGSALLLQALYEKGLSHSKETALKAKLALMNTAKVVMDPRTNGEAPYSPRIQGSGLMQIQNAINTPVVVSRRDTPLEQAGAVALKEIGQTTSFKLNVEAFETPKGKNNSEDIEYKVYVDVLKDKTTTKEFDIDADGTLDPKEYLTLSSEHINGAEVYVNDQKVTNADGASLKIKPGQNKMLTVNISLPEDLKKNIFVEGFVRLVPVEKSQDKAVPLSVPYMGFYGKWDELRNLDAPAWEKDRFLGYTALWDDNSENYPLGYDPLTGKYHTNRIAYSPNYFLSGIYSTFTVLRNLQKADMYIEDASGNLIKYLGDYSENPGWKFRKSVMANSMSYRGYQWDMKDESGQYVQDGVYQYVVKTTLSYPGARPQIVKMPITVDSVSPTVSDIISTPKNGKYEISFNAEDNASDFHSAIVWVNGVQYSLGVEQKSFLVNAEPKSIVVLAVDFAGNQSYKVWGDPSYIKPTMVVQTINVSPSTNVNQNNPARITAFAYSRVDWNIKIKDAAGNIVDTIEVKNAHQIRQNWTPKAELPNGTYYVTADAVTKDGFKVTTLPKTVTVRQ